MCNLLLWALLINDHHLGRVSARYTTAISPSRNASSARLDFRFIFVVALETILARFCLQLLLLVLLDLRINLLIELLGPLLLVSQDFLASIRIHVGLVAFEQCLTCGRNNPGHIFHLWHRIRVLVFLWDWGIFVTLSILSLLAAILLLSILLIWESSLYLLEVLRALIIPLLYLDLLFQELGNLWDFHQFFQLFDADILLRNTTHVA